MKSKDRKIIIGIVLIVLIVFAGIKIIGFQYSGIDKKAILTIKNITE
ncbi:hypothetical protein [Romboutsia sp. 1001216sp1]|nr:hypothetical protein [Romboutsia sp. 1001216sp1]MDB8804760.1 hypothetical protein [Romboutsia sp. 1001216sp1]MDB8809107.1 hypothetical protein [Romboutsia sp. 1001216sp1]MDB8810406.1 hypothetical protein [Romboutsia sp. 1001216sp1]MDB8816125.1 hypothetical protein [Romboutsia sp. 1001216sp1]MDB8818921.1 hypothetical protein [Romboutsia sp. 1001216sp1]